MIEIATFGLMVLALIVGALARDYWRARRDRQRAALMIAMTAEYTSQPVWKLVATIGEPYEWTPGTSGRSLYIWKAPPNAKLPSGTGLLTVVATVDADGTIAELTWRDTT